MDEKLNEMFSNEFGGEKEIKLFNVPSTQKIVNKPKKEGGVNRLLSTFEQTKEQNTKPVTSTLRNRLLTNSVKVRSSTTISKKSVGEVDFEDDLDNLNIDHNFNSTHNSFNGNSNLRGFQHHATIGSDPVREFQRIPINNENEKNTRSLAKSQNNIIGKT